MSNPMGLDIGYYIYINFAFHYLPFHLKLNKILKNHKWKKTSI